MYIESLFLLDFWLDFLILITTGILLKRKIKFFNILLACFIGSTSVIILFLNIYEIQSLILKIYFSIILILVAFGYQNIKYLFLNLVTFYFINFMLGGVFYLFKLENIYHSMIFLCILSPFFLYIYIRQAKIHKKKEKLFYDTDIYIKDIVLNLPGFLDSGNTLIHKNNLVIITNIDNVFDERKIYIPYNTIGNFGLLECIKVDKVVVDGKEFTNVLLGFSKNFEIEGANVLLNSKMGE